MSATGVSLDVARELRAICGEEFVVDDPEKLQHNWVNLASPSVAIWPGSADETAAVLRVANDSGLDIVPAGGGTRQYFGRRERAKGVLYTTRLTEVEHYDHADLTVGVGAGTTVAQLNAMLGADKLMFAADPPLPEHCTVGGLLATASHGPLRHGFGAVRDFCIGVRFVSGDGRKAKGGGRVVKNVAGYDLMKLLIGSYGTLGVITSASFKLFPAPRQTRTFLAEFASAKDTLDFRDRVMRSPLSPMCLELVCPEARKLMRPEMASDGWVMCVRAAGSDAVLARYRKELGSAITREVEGEAETKMWRAIEDFPITSEYRQSDNWMRHLPMFMRTLSLVVPPADVLSVTEIVKKAAHPEVTGAAIIGRVGIGHIMARLWTIHMEVQQPEPFVIEELAKQLSPAVNITDSIAPNPWPIAPPHLASMRAVKQAMDPKNVLRGREIF